MFLFATIVLPVIGAVLGLYIKTKRNAYRFAELMSFEECYSQGLAEWDVITNWDK